MAMQKDPVCGMNVDDQKSAIRSEFQGSTYYFCDEECKRKFEQQPELYAGKSDRAMGGGTQD